MLPPVRIAAATRCFGQPLKIAISTAAEIGVTGLQLDAQNELRASELSESGRRQFLHRLTDARMSVASLHVPLERPLSDRDDLDARIDQLRKAMTFAWQLKSRTVTARIGRIPEPGDSAERLTLVDALNDLARHGNHVGAIFSFTTIGDPPASIVELLSDVDQGPIGIHLDPAGLVAGGHKAVDYLVQLRESISQIQIRDAVREIDGGSVETAVGRGEVVWDELLAVAHEAEFSGWMTIERRSGDDRIADMGRAVKFVRNLLPG